MINLKEALRDSNCFIHNIKFFNAELTASEIRKEMTTSRFALTDHIYLPSQRGRKE